MIKNCTIISLIILLFAGSCRKTESENSGPNKTTPRTEKMEVAYTFLLKKLQQDNLNLIASRDNKSLTLIQNIIHKHSLNIEVEYYNNIELGPDFIHYSKSTKKAVAIIDIKERNGNRYYISYYLGPEGGASKEILIEKTSGKWSVVNDDEMWIVK